MNKMPKTIMVVDDEQDIIDTVRGVLEPRGYKILTASDGDDCLKQLESTKPDLILMDIMMPGTSVKEVVPKIDKDINIAYLSVVRPSDAEREGLHFSNIVDFIQKPFSVNELLQKVRIFCKEKWTD